MDEILQKIKNIRNIKGYSYENMADELKISTSAYRKIESNETKLTVERLFQIAKILETPVNNLLGENGSNVYYQNNHESGTLIGSQNFENYYHQENRETIKKLIQTLEKEIEHLKEEIIFLREMKK